MTQTCRVRFRFGGFYGCMLESFCSLVVQGTVTWAVGMPGIPALRLHHLMYLPRLPGAVARALLIN